MVGVSEARAKALTVAGKPIPQPQAIRALVDTGASVTCVDPLVFAALGLTPTGNASMNTPSTGSTPHSTPTYDVSILIGGPPNTVPIQWGTVQVAATALYANQGFHALIGRNLLQSCILVYNGTMGFYTLAF